MNQLSKNVILILEGFCFVNILTKRGVENFERSTDCKRKCVRNDSSNEFEETNKFIIKKMNYYSSIEKDRKSLKKVEELRTKQQSYHYKIKNKLVLRDMY
ncbi:hypothetical protein HZS_5268 [Henneguya salminicola]|nr:hypothetical protein HZS_5268 [Henneguya salminicola]